MRVLIKENIGETDYLDFKTEWPEFPKLAKHILALSNSGGGALVIGVIQHNDGTIESVGLHEMLDKEKINKGLKAYLPIEISYDTFDFSYQESEYPDIKGKKFQVLLVEYNSRHIPFLSKKAGNGIKDNVVYVRRGTNSDEASHEELQKIINERIETGFSSTHILELSKHLEQLKILYKEKPDRQRLYVEMAIGSMFIGGLKEYREFLDKVIQKKEQKIEEELGLM